MFRVLLDVPLATTDLLGLQLSSVDVKEHYLLGADEEEKEEQERLQRLGKNNSKEVIITKKTKIYKK
jgi:hypothetical protein